MSNISRVNLFLTLLLIVGLLSLFIQSMSLAKRQAFLEKRTDALEMKPVSINENNIPVAGQSGTLNTSDINTLIDQKLANSVKPSDPIVASQTPKPTQSPTPVTKKVISYVPIFGGSFSTTSTSWTDVTGSDFQLNIGDYGSNSYATFDTTVLVLGGSGEVGVRIFDITNGVTVTGSEVSGQGSSPTLVTSGKLVFFSGNNTYRIQIKSKTSSTVRFDSGRIKIVY